MYETEIVGPANLCHLEGVSKAAEGEFLFLSHQYAIILGQVLGPEFKRHYDFIKSI